MVHKVIGNIVVEWESDKPLYVRLHGESGPASRRRQESFTFNLIGLRQGYTDDFLINLRDLLIKRNNQVQFSTMIKEVQNIKKCLQQVLDVGAFKGKIAVIDDMFLLCLSAEKEHLSTFHLRYLKQVFNSDPLSPIFKKGLHQDDFPTHLPKKGRRGEAIDRILAKAMTRATVASILDHLDNAYAKGEIDIGLYSLGHLCFAVFGRNESYRQITLGDLKFDATSKQYFVDIVAAKSRKHIPAKVRYRINESLGLLLVKQRQHIIEKYGHIVAKEDIANMALFPMRQLRKDGTWRSSFANRNFGMYPSSTEFAQGYQKAIKKKLGNHMLLGNNQLRHTLGTLLAQTGASAKTIQAVLKHATDATCKYYVDIAFHGLMIELSDAMEPAFARHLPSLLNLKSKNDPVTTEKRICTEDVTTGSFEELGECGKDIACSSAPIACYGCFRFNPCWDADHSINLHIVEKEIAQMSKRGKPFQHMVDRAKQAKNHILLVMNAVALYRDSIKVKEI
ncbi:TPA: tyrosine-type recombinase/integrase [Vibrio parahaemolyticus]|uniref:tyrosine-type recombinase/integrase n=1 Tax=Vibrio parahaemolyticus TaxID=670 RepID=UPI00186A6406|nr:tyrosine-type recombinase/integrase [Vibrio parahaemolyticus]MBE4173699.1 tyrosine-type recombinase/integrase [Vibrio parahaemolyticus]MCR9757222.1 tyrosine-type recombinase/integrase [Vibrio parahaemolyticus]